MTRAAIRLCYGVSLFCLPLVGVGLLRLSTGRDWGGGLQPSWVFLAAATILAAFHFSRPGNRLSLRARLAAEPVLRIAGLFAAAAGVAVLLSGLGLWIAPVSEPRDHTLLRFAKQAVQLGIMGVFAAWPALWTRGPARWRWTARWVVAGALFQVLYGALQGAAWGQDYRWFGALERVFTSNPAILSGSEGLYLDNTMLPVVRLRGTVCEPLYLGNYLLLALPAVLLTGWRPIAKVAIAVVLGLLLGLTWSRGAWLAGIAGLGLGFFLLAGRPGARPVRISRRAALQAAGALGALALLVGFLAPELDWGLPLRRLLQSFSTRDWSNLTRIYSMQAAWRAFQLSPLVGIGWGQFGWHFPLLVDPVGLQSQFTWAVVNNFPLEILCETGLLGFGVLAAGCIAVTAAIGRRLAAGGPGFGPEQGRLVASATGCAAVWLQLLTFSQYNLPHIWVALGLLLAALADGDHAEAPS